LSIWTKRIKILIQKPKYIDGNYKKIQDLVWRIKMKIMKRDGTLVPFNKEKIINAINAAFIEVDG